MSLEIIPSVDLRNGQVVRLQQGDYARQITYDVDPFMTAAAFKAAGARWMHVVDLDGAKEGASRQMDLIGQLILICGLNVQVGGGVRSEEDIRRILDAGAQRVVLGTAAFENWEWFKTLAHEPRYDRRLVLAIDAKEGVVATRGWTALSGRRAVDVAGEVSDWPLAGLLYTDVACDGMLSGPNIEHTQRLAEAGKVPVIASGGVGSLEHIRRLKELPIAGVIVGRSLYEGTVDLRLALRIAST